MLKSFKRPNYYQFLFLLLCSGIIGLTACENPNTPLEPEENTATASFFIELSKVAADLIVRVEVVVTGSDMAEIHQDLKRQGDIYTGALEVPAGNNRSFTLNGYDANGTLIYTGKENADVIVNKRIQVEITMRRIAASSGDIDITGTFLLNP